MAFKIRKIPINIKSYLIFSGLFFIFSGLFYSIMPLAAVAKMLDIALMHKTDGVMQILRTTMGMYAGVGIFLICGAYIARYQHAALLVQTLCMGGLVIGRMLGFVSNGFSPVFAVMAFWIELVFLCFSLWFLLQKTYSTKKET